jgi:hypothetical protein
MCVRDKATSETRVQDSLLRAMRSGRLTQASLRIPVLHYRYARLGKATEIQRLNGSEQNGTELANSSQPILYLLVSGETRMKLLEPAVKPLDV